MRKVHLALGSVAIGFLHSLALTPILASAQVSSTDKPSKVTLQQVIEAARANYPSILAARAQHAASAAAVGVARSAYLPRADLLWQTNRATANNIYGLLLPQSVIPNISGPVIAADTGRSAWSSGTGVLFDWQPFDFGARSAKVSAARHGSEAAEQAALLTELQVTTAAGSAFFDLAAAERLVTVAQANLRRIETFDKVVHVLVENTLRPGADASQADAQLALAHNQLIQAQTQASIRRAALAQYLVRPMDQAEIDVDKLIAALPATDPAQAQAARNPAALEEDALVKRQEAQELFLDRSYVPVVHALGAVSGRGAGTSMNGNFPGGTEGLAPNTFNWAAGLQVTFAAFDYFGIREQKKVQAANIQNEEARYAQALKDVSLAIVQARATLAGARQVAANTPTELKAAQTSEQQQQARYRSGLASIVDVVVAEALLAQAESDDAIARLSVWRAELGVAAAQGDIQPLLTMLQNQPEGK
jgi:outer membrane protein TolC